MLMVLACYLAQVWCTYSSLPRTIYVEICYFSTINHQTSHHQLIVSPLISRSLSPASKTVIIMNVLSLLNKPEELQGRVNYEHDFRNTCIVYLDPDRDLTRRKGLGLINRWLWCAFAHRQKPFNHWQVVKVVYVFMWKTDGVKWGTFVHQTFRTYICVHVAFLPALPVYVNPKAIVNTALELILQMV